jgi:hypothetical protein
VEKTSAIKGPKQNSAIISVPRNTAGGTIWKKKFVQGVEKHLLEQKSKYIVLMPVQ